MPHHIFTEVFMRYTLELQLQYISWRFFQARFSHCSQAIDSLNFLPFTCKLGAKNTQKFSLQIDLWTFWEHWLTHHLFYLKISLQYINRRSGLNFISKSFFWIIFWMNASSFVILYFLARAFSYLTAATSFIEGSYYLGVYVKAVNFR